MALYPTGQITVGKVLDGNSKPGGETPGFVFEESDRRAVIRVIWYLASDETGQMI